MGRFAKQTATPKRQAGAPPGTVAHSPEAKAVARLRPRESGDRFEVLYWSAFRERWRPVGPFGGMVLSRDVEIGSPVSSILNLGANGTLVMVLGDVSSVYVRGKVDEADVGLVQIGQPARIKVETFKDRPFEGRVTQIAPMGVERDNVVSFEVRVSIDNATGALRANMTANAEIVLEEHKGALIIPESAVVYDTVRRTFADVPSAGEKTGRRRVPIKVGISNGTRTEVLGGLTQGQRVVVQ